jgi:hypothetical protein
MAKEWSWSFSKKKNFDTCPKRYYEIDIQKNFTEDTAQLTWGNEVHKGLAAACLHGAGIPSSGKGRDMVVAAPLPDTMKLYKPWVDVVVRAPGTLKVEEKYAITRDFQQTPYFAPNVWYRGICDILKLNGKDATALDWKTGGVKHNSVQLMLMATCIFIHYPQIETVKTRFIWLQDECTTRDEWRRDSIMSEWNSLIPEVNAMEQAQKTLTFPPKPSGLCRKYCPVTSCVYHGKGGHS